MSPAPQPTPKPLRVPATLIGVGVLVVALGFGLPMFASGPVFEKPAPATKAANEAKDAPPDGPAPIVPPSATGLWPALARLAIGLAIVCGLCVLAAKWLGQKPPAAPGVMEVLASIQVARCVVHLVRAGDRRLLIGTDLGGVKSLLELPGPAPVLPPTPEAATATAPPAPDAGSPPPAPAAAAPPNREELLALLAKLLARPGASPPA
jgi:hypothetical protein